MVLRFNDGTMHRLRCDDGDDRVSRQVSTGGRDDRLIGVTRQILIMGSSRLSYVDYCWEPGIVCGYFRP